ncbi:substrate-binding domain-containing protein [Parapedobacter sp. ISTM3]|uniref:Transcriptional regulator, LacI family n=1 Tax=Parapedobacter luteus TaxID=623280 RepID=A0A1T5DRR4_9SPHI|nr:MULTISPECIES: substrate-binding domain-containing protein [Parapedobacter]MBK1440869.1 substrate-binding domain-containing protein [Parapedobacter sp. ISTM3]SKB74196.1 transcriptional regulator, LacI family [Parapedobacter luteus]
MKKKILISDIAKDLGVSVTTVSFILNGKAKEKRISEGLTKRVLAHVQKVGYKPNELAKSLRTGKTKIIGLVIEDISNPFFANIARLIETRAYSKGYRIIYCSTDNQPDKTIELIQLFRDRHVDGYIITPSEGVDDTIQSLINSQLPLVLFDRYIPGLATNYVVSDNVRGAYDATAHLAQQGYRRIALVTLYSSQTQMQDRMNGYMRAIDSYKLQPYVKKVNMGDDEETTVRDFHAFLQDQQPDAIFFATNYLAITGLKALKHYQTPLPGVVSYDDHTLFKLFTPTITAVSQPIEAIADELINVLLNQLDGKIKEVKQIVLPSELIVRESSRGRISSTTS